MTKRQDQDYQDHRRQDLRGRDRTSDADTADAVTRVHRYLRFLGADPEAAADLTQEAQLLSLERWPAGDPPLPWLLATARNLHRQALRQYARRRELVDADRLHELWHDHVEDCGEAERLALRECLALLPERSRTALRLRYTDGASRTRIAGQLELSLEGTKSLLQRARAALSECVRRRMQ